MPALAKNVTSTSSRGRVRVAAVVLTGVAALLLATACAKSSATNGEGGLGINPPASSASPSGAGATSPGSPTATATVTATATAPATHAPATHAYPSDYAGAILAAWGASDFNYLELLTNTSTAHHIVHDLGVRNQHWTLIRSDGAMGSSYVSYYNAAGDYIVIRLSNEQTSAHHWHAGSLQTWDVMTFPSDPVAYTRVLVSGWMTGNVARMKLISEDAMTGILQGMTPPADTYTISAGTPSGGQVEVEVTDPSSSIDISFIVVTATLPHQHAIQGCDIGC